MDKLLRILFDGNAMVLRTGATHRSGIGRITMELAKALDELNDPGVDVRLLTQTFRGRVDHTFKHLPITNLPYPIGPRFDWLLEKTPVREIWSPHDILHIPFNFAKVHRLDHTVATIHDAIFFSHPEDFLGHAFAREVAPKFAQSIRAITTASESAKSDIVHYLGVPPEKVTVIPWGVDKSIFNASDKPGAKKRVAAQTGSARPYFLSVSCSQGRKNTISVLRAYRDALRGNLDHDLLLVWGNPPDIYRQEFAKEINSGRIRFLKHVSDEQLGDLYAGATASYFPSRYEGFGLPILESMACGTPVVTCRNSSLFEVGGETAIYVDPDGVDEMTDLMRKFDGGDSRNTEHCMSACLAQAEKFSWAQAATGYLEFYQKSALGYV